MESWIRKLDAFLQEGRRVVLVTVVKVTGSTPREVGARMLVVDDGRCTGTIGGGRLEELADGREDVTVVSTSNALAHLTRTPVGYFSSPVQNKSLNAR